jgi:hypothetical protein
MSHTTGIEGHEGSQEQASHRAIDNGNPANFKPVYFILDDINIDLITFLSSIVSILAVVLRQLSPFQALFIASAIILPLRLFLPRSTKPTGLVLVTGASSGIGAELSYIFASHGHDLVLVGRNEDQLRVVQDAIEQKYHRTAHVVSTDLSVPGAAKHLYDKVVQQGLEVNVLVNGAGLGGAGDVLEQPIELTARMTILNCVSPVQLTQLFGRDMAERGRGWLLHISSVGGE